MDIDEMFTWLVEAIDNMEVTKEESYFEVFD
jgi:hypothetical protein